MLAAAFNAVLTGKDFTPQYLQAHVCIIPKLHTDATHWSSFRPISLINVDLKILTKILATRLKAGIGSLIHSDQTGFMPGRQASDNIWKIMHLTHLAQTRNIPTMLLAVDINKAFDSVTCPYLMYILSKWGLALTLLDGFPYSITLPRPE